MNIEVLRTVLLVVSLVMWTAAWLPPRTPKSMAGRFAVGCLTLAVHAFLVRQFLWFWWDAAVFAVAVWWWWKSGGDDDWRKRRRKAAAWARSHLPRPTVVRIRLGPVGAP